MDRIQKIIAASGYCSRRKAEELIKKGKVEVNGKIAEIGESADEKARILVDGHKLVKAKSVYYLINKPRGYVTSLKDPYEKTVIELMDVDESVYPAGRLDKDAEGLLLLTNNGDLANKVMHPSFEIEKTYIVKTYDDVPREFLEFMNKYGVLIKDGWVDVKVKRKSVKNYEVKIHVGYHKVVKKIFDKFGIRVQRLVRTKIGLLDLGKLKPKQYRFLSEKKSKELEEYMSKVKKKGKNWYKTKRKKAEFEEAFRSLKGIKNEKPKKREEREPKEYIKPRSPRKVIEKRPEEERSVWGKTFPKKKPIEKGRSSDDTFENFYTKEGKRKSWRDNKPRDKFSKSKTKFKPKNRRN